MQQLAVDDAAHQAQAVFEELMRLKSLKPSLNWNGCAVLARTNRMLSPVRAVFEEGGHPGKNGAWKVDCRCTASARCGIASTG